MPPITPTSLTLIHTDGADVQKALATDFARFSTDITSKTKCALVLGGDGFMLSCFHQFYGMSIPLYGLNFGTLGFYMHPYRPGMDVMRALNNAVLQKLPALSVKIRDESGKTSHHMAFNEIALLRQSGQSAKIRVEIDGVMRINPLVGDGLILATPAGSTAYNYSAGGPVVPVDANVLPLTAINAHTPKRWQGALIPHTSTIVFHIDEPHKRPVHASIDGKNTPDVHNVEVILDAKQCAHVLFDRNNPLSERLMGMQFHT